MDLNLYPFLILSFLGWLGIIVILLSKKVSFFKKFANTIIEGTRKSGAKNQNENMWQIPTKYARLSDTELEGVSSKIINVLAILAGIYGILFALIVSEKASLVFVSWSFSIWCGWVLAILMRIGHCCTILMTDYHQWERKKKEETLQGISIFIKHSMYLLVFTASYVPIFAVMKTVNIEEILGIYPWKQEASLFFGVLSIIISASIIYEIILSLEGFIKQTFSIYPPVVLSLWLIGLASIHSSPLAPRSFMWIAYFYNYPIPSVLKWTEFIFTGIGMIMTIPMLKVIIRFFHQNSQRIIAILR